MTITVNQQMTSMLATTTDFYWYLVNCHVAVLALVVSKVKTSDVILFKTFLNHCARHPKQSVSRFLLFNIMGRWWGVLS